MLADPVAPFSDNKFLQTLHVQHCVFFTSGNIIYTSIVHVYWVWSTMIAMAIQLNALAYAESKL